MILESYAHPDEYVAFKKRCQDEWRQYEQQKTKMENLKIQGTITKIFEIEKGTSKAGKEWQKINFLLDTGAQFNPEVCFQIFGEDKANNFVKYNKEGERVDVSFNISSREHEGRYYHNIDAWRVEKVAGEVVQEAEVIAEAGDDDDLPF